MSASRDAILGALRSASARLPCGEPPRAYAAPALDASVAALAESLAAAGATLVCCAAGEVAAALARIPGFASATHLWSELSDAPARGVAASAREPRDLAPLEFAVLTGAVIVAENGAVWHAPRSRLERAAALLAEHLVLVVDEDALVASLHDAYARIDLAASPCGWFLAGPSKTADIEQSLVLGAHGPCTATVLLRAK